jgi:hypothetical protein
VSTTQAFALRADHEDFVGGTLAWGPGQQTFNVGEELEKNGGVIIVETDDATPTEPGNQLLVEALSAYPALKHIPLADAQKQRAAAIKEQAKSIPKQEAQAAAEHASSEPVDEATLRAMDNETLWGVVDDLKIKGLKSDSIKDDLVSAILNKQKEGDA